MQFTVNIKDESKVDFLLQLLSEFKFVEILNPSKGSTNGKLKNYAVPRKKRLTADEQKLVGELSEAFREVELFNKGKVRLQTLQEFLAEES